MICAHAGQNKIYLYIAYCIARMCAEQNRRQNIIEIAFTHPQQLITNYMIYVRHRINVIKVNIVLCSAQSFRTFKCKH